MSTIFVNGSPKGEKGNTHVFLTEITKNIKNNYTIKTLTNESVDEIADEMDKYETVIIAMPLYVHAMPGLVKELFEKMKINQNPKRKLGFIVQAGFEEGSAADCLKTYLELYAKRMNYNYIKMLMKPSAAGLTLMPRFMNRKLIKDIGKLGYEYDKYGYFLDKTISDFGNPHRLSASQIKRFESPLAKRINKSGWNHYLKKNNALDKSRDRPFI